MSTYAFGDLQGCYRTLRALLRQIPFDARSDRIWLVGDLVARGPGSLDVLRWARDAGDSLVAVLGNHDLNLLATDLGLRAPRARDRFEAVLEAGDRDDLLGWLARRPLLHREGGFVLVHAGLLPVWSLELAEQLAREAADALRGPGRRELLAGVRRISGKARWASSLPESDRRPLALKILTSIRVCTAEGVVHFGFRGDPRRIPPGYRPWYEDERCTRGRHRIVFGHWSDLGLHLAPQLAGLDTGCVWGRKLTAMRLEDGRVFQERRVGSG